MRLLQALVKTVIHIDAHENMGNTLIYNGLLDYKTRTTSPRLFPKSSNPTTKPRTPPHICLPNHQIQPQNQEHFPAFVYQIATSENKRGQK